MWAQFNLRWRTIIKVQILWWLQTTACTQQQSIFIIIILFYGFWFKSFPTSCCFRAVRVASSRCSSAPITLGASGPAWTEVTGSSRSTLRAQLTMSLCLSFSKCSSCSPARAACSLSPTLLRSTPPAAALIIPAQDPFLLSMPKTGARACPETKCAQRNVLLAK